MAAATDAVDSSSTGDALGGGGGDDARLVIAPRLPPAEDGGSGDVELVPLVGDTGGSSKVLQDVAAPAAAASAAAAAAADGGLPRLAALVAADVPGVAEGEARDTSFSLCERGVLWSVGMYGECPGPPAPTPAKSLPESAIRLRRVFVHRLRRGVPVVVCGAG